MTESADKQLIIDKSKVEDDGTSIVLAEESKSDGTPEATLEGDQASTPEGSTNVGLRLGDIIEINSPSNKSLDKHIFVITYIDETQISIIDTTTLESKELFITNGRLNDESIVDISLLNRDEKAGYARQNNLLHEP